MNKSSKTISSLKQIIQVVKISNTGEITYVHKPKCEITDRLEKTFGGVSEKLSDIEFNNGWYAIFKNGEKIGPANTYAECTRMEWDHALLRFLSAGEEDGKYTGHPF